jgi:histone acetyltransferase SAS2
MGKSDSATLEENEVSIATDTPTTPLRRSKRNMPRDSSSPVKEQSQVTEETNKDEYGFLDYRNVARIRLGKYEFDTWYGNSTFFKEPRLNKTDDHFYTELEFKENNLSALIQLSPSKSSKISSAVSGSKQYKVDPARKQPWLDVLYVCPYCFKFTDIKLEWEQHLNCCTFKSRLPGKVMYNDGETIIRKVKGANHKLFSQCMCLMAKFYLDNKSVFYHLDYFDFYVAYQLLDRHEVPMGFYSRELLSWDSNNLSCICVLPCYQKRHLGTKLIDFSYQLSKYEQQISGPEHPLSALGRITYLKYWCKSIALNFTYGELSTKSHVTLQMISEKTGFRVDDILQSLSTLRVLYENGKKTPDMDYYLERYKYSDHYVFISDDEFRVYIDKSKIKKWIIDNKVGNKTELDRDCFVFY